MHLTPEQIDRQPFRMTRRGYDIVQVRNFLREIADEMRARQEVRERLAANGEDGAVAEDQAHHILEDARRRADEIVAEAETKAGSVDALDSASSKAQEIVAAAELEASELIESAELRAHQEERELSEKVEIARAELEPPEPAPMLSDSRDVVTIEMKPDNSLADFMKSTLRHEVHPD